MGLRHSEPTRAASVEVTSGHGSARDSRGQRSEGQPSRQRNNYQHGIPPKQCFRFSFIRLGACLQCGGEGTEHVGSK